MSGMQTAPYQDFAREKLGFEFKNIDYLVTALTHRSYVNEHKKSVSEHNERLEFLGDAVLELVVTDHLFRNFNEPEGILTSWRASLVRTESIGEAGDKLGYEPLIRMSKGEKNGSRSGTPADSRQAVSRQLLVQFTWNAATMTPPLLFMQIYYRSSMQSLLRGVGVIQNHICKKYLNVSTIIRQCIVCLKKWAQTTIKSLHSVHL